MFFDNADTDLISDDVQNAIAELDDKKELNLTRILIMEPKPMPLLKHK